MARRPVDYRPGRTDPGYNITPSARPIDLSHYYQAERQAAPINLGPFIDIAGDFFRTQEYKKEKGERKAAQAEKIKKEQEERAAEVYFAKGADALSGSKEEYDKYIKEAGLPASAGNYFQIHLAALSGDRIGGKAENELNQYKKIAAAVVDDNGDEKAPLDVEKLKKDIWSKYSNHYSLNIEEGFLAASIRWDKAKEKFDDEVGSLRAANREEYSSYLQQQKYFDVIDTFSKVISPTDEEKQLFQGAVYSLNKIGSQYGSFTSRKDTLEGLKRGLQSLGAEKALGMIDTIANTPIGDSGVIVGRDIEGSDMLNKLRINASKELESAKKRSVEENEASEKAFKSDVNKYYFTQLADGVRSGKTVRELTDAIRSEILTVKPGVNRMALESELSDMVALVNRQASEGDVNTERAIRDVMFKGFPVDDLLERSDIRASLSGTQFERLVADNEKGKEIDNILKKTTLTPTLKKIRAPIETAFSGRSEDSSELRAALSEHIEPLIKQFEDSIRTDVENKKPILDINDRLAKSLDSGGLAQTIKNEIATFNKSRSELLSKIKEKTAHGQDATGLLPEEDDTESEAAKLLGRKEAAKLWRENIHRADPSRFMATGREFSERYERFVGHTYSKLLKESGLTILSPSFDEVSYSKASGIANLAYYGYFVPLWKTMRMDASIDSKDLDQVATLALDAKVTELIRESLKMNDNKSAGAPKK